MKLFNNIYIDLDSLLDTRLGIISMLDETAVEAMVKAGHYWTRVYDDWEVLTEGKVTNTAFNEAWEQRTNEVLRASMLTEIFGPLRNILTLYTQNIKEGHVDKPLCMTVNMYPYTLSDDEQEGISEALKYHVGADFSVFFVSITDDELTPALLFSRYDAAFMYHFHKWIVKHGFALANQPTPDFVLMVPRLFTKDPTDLSQDAQKDEFLVTALQLRYYINLEFIGSHCFSMLHPYVLRPQDGGEPPATTAETPSPE